MATDRFGGLAAAAALSGETLHPGHDAERPLGTAAPDPAPDPAAAAFAAPHDRSTLKRASVHGVAVTFLSQGFRFVLQFGAQIVLAHWLRPGEFGLIAMVAPVLSLVQVFNDLGLTQATIQRADIAHRELSTLFWINFGASACLAASMAAAAPLVAWFYHEPRLTLITAACGSLLLLSGAAAQQIALMNRRMRYTRLAIIDVACAFMAFVVGLGAAWLGCGYWSLVLMQAANSATILGLAWLLSDWRPSLPTRDRGVGALLAGVAGRGGGVAGAAACGRWRRSGTAGRGAGGGLRHCGFGVARIVGGAADFGGCLGAAGGDGQVGKCWVGCAIPPVVTLQRGLHPTTNLKSRRGGWGGGTALLRPRPPPHPAGARSPPAPGRRRWRADRPPRSRARR